jgi:outer membrane protein assembly factor BamB
MHTHQWRKKVSTVSRRCDGAGPRPLAVSLLVALTFFSAVGLTRAASGWLEWRGPDQNGSAREAGLPEQVAPTGGNLLWTADFPGKGTPVTADGHVYVTGYLGDGAELQEGLACYDAETGELRWRSMFNDYLSDTVYHRYATSSPAVDGETGNVYLQGTQGLLAGFTPEGRLLWKHELMEQLGRLTFPNSRTASPLIDRELVITRGITANWGTQAAGGDRFYAFDKHSGELVWASSPADRPKDNSFSHPILDWLDGRRVFYAATGDGSVVCVNARTGDPLWRIPLFKAGINATLLVHEHERIIAVFGTPYELGQMVALKIPHLTITNAAAGPIVVDRAQCELWHCDISSSTSSPILVGDRAYIVAEKGDLCAVDVRTGRLLWKLKLGIEQRNACLLYADGRLYVPVLEDPDSVSQDRSDTGSKGAFYIIKPTDEKGEILCHTALQGRCFGTPTAYRGKIYVQTAAKLYCFGRRGGSDSGTAEPTPAPWPAPGAAAQLQILPAEVLLKPGERATFRVRVLDQDGLVVNDSVDPRDVKWNSFIPPSAKVKSKMQGRFGADGSLTADSEPVPSAGMWVAEYRGLKGYVRGRILPGLPIREDWSSFKLDQLTTNSVEPPTPFAYPPLPWIGARFKFEVREREGERVLAKTIDNKFFQRAFVFIADPALKNYTVQAQVLSDGNRRKMSDVGVINQRYLVVLKGNEQKLEITSNQELFHFSAPFTWLPNTWYSLKARVDTLADGTGVVRAKAWKSGEAEPATWTLEAPHQHANLNGSPGLFGFSPQEMRIFLKDISVTAN